MWRPIPGRAAVSRDYYRYQTMADVNAALEEMERELLLSAAPAITGEAVGRALRLEDSAERRFPELGVLGWCGLNGVPAPESPAEMAAAGTEGSVTVQAGGRNLCDFQQWRTMTTIVNGGTMTTTDRSATLTATAGECYSMYTEGHTLKIPAAPNTKYTLSWKAAGTAGSVYVFCNASAEAGHLFEAGGTRGALTFTTTADTRFLTFRLGVSGVGNTVTYSEIMLNIGEKAEYLPYAPVTGAKLSTPGGLLGIPVPSGGNVADETGQRWICDEIVGEKLVRRCRKVAFDGTEAWSQNSANHFLTTVLSPMPAGAVLCTHLPYLRDYVGNGCYCDGPVLVVGGSVGAGYTVERWKAFLAGEAARGTPVTAVYALASPVETELAAGEAAAMAALRTQRAETSLHCTDDAWARAQYIMDTRLYIDRKFRELAAAVVVSGE